ncbi:TPA: hypothetical protein DEG21_01270 [Patescibacteria group bacterium]|nr:hypothetical protein [Candidatus Gracilibacteria bacterium]
MRIRSISSSFTQNRTDIKHTTKNVVCTISDDLDQTQLVNTIENSFLTIFLLDAFFLVIFHIIYLINVCIVF